MMANITCYVGKHSLLCFAGFHVLVNEGTMCFYEQKVLIVICYAMNLAEIAYFCNWKFGCNG